MAFYAAVFASGWLYWVLFALPWRDVSIAEFTHSVASTTIACAGMALVITEIGNAIRSIGMVIGATIKEHFDRQRERRERLLRLEGRRQALQEWREWDERREKAEQRGESFNEPPPSE